MESETDSDGFSAFSLRLSLYDSILETHSNFVTIPDKADKPKLNIRT